MIGVKVRTVDNIGRFTSKTVMGADLAIARMVADMERLAKSRVPLDTGALQSSGRTRRIGLGKYKLAFSTPYARRWEFESANFKHGRQSRYLRSSFRDVSRKFDTYLRNAIKT